WPVREGGLVRLSWSERLRGGWTPLRVGSDGIRVGADRPVCFQSSAGADGQPVVTVLGSATGEAAPPRPVGPLLGDAPPFVAPVLGAFRLSGRGPVVVDVAGDGAGVPLPVALRVPGQLRLAREDGTDLLVL